MKSIILLGLVAVCAANVLDLGDSDFDSKLANVDTALVMFYAPWCGHCKKLKPEFKAAGPILAENDPPVQLVQVDCTEAGKATCSRFGVSGYPTVKIFKSGSLSSDYNGPRDKSGIVKYMASQVGPVSKKLVTVEDCEKFLSKPEPAVIFFGGESELQAAFLGAADLLRESVRFGHTEDEAAIAKYEQKADTVVLFRTQIMKNKFEPAAVVYDGANCKHAMKKFIKDNIHGLVGHRTQDTAADFSTPLVVAYFNVDYAKNVKGTNYWRNRVLKVAQKFSPEYNFAIANNNDFNHELEEFGINYVEGDKPAVCARDADGMKFIMKEEFSVDNLESFLNDLKEGKVEPFIKSEPVPESQGNVIVGVGKNFKEVITNSGRDALIEFYAPWCGHCKKLTPIYDELGDLMKDEDVDIIKVDATANDVDPSYNVRGFPTLFWKPAQGTPEQYQGGRELNDFVKYIAKHATSELKGFDRSGEAKAQKTEL